MAANKLTGLKINDRYEIISRLASGGMADVYLGYDTKQSKKVAIKILHENYSSNRNFIARFKSEAKILSRLSNPNIVVIYDWGEFNDMYFIIMEYVSGVSLKKIIEKNGSLGARLTASYSIQICNALQEAHSNNLVHRDIKPQNIMITEDGQLKLTDFGIAKTVANDITKTMGILGTAHYVSPEQAQGKILDYRSDIYSLGIVMYEMLSGDVPFRGGSSIDISLSHISEAPQPISSLTPGISPKIEKIVMKCLQKFPAQRYANAGELKKDLENFLEGRELSFEKAERLAESGQSKFKLGFFKKPVPRNNASSVPVGQYGMAQASPAPHSEINYAKYAKKMLRLRNFLFVLITFFAALFFIFLSLFLINYNRSASLMDESSYITVPPLVNVRAEQAKSILSTFSLNLKITDTVFSSSIEKDFIISQEPKEGARISKGSVINAVVSKGSEIISLPVPNITGMDKDIAVKTLEDSGFLEGEISEEFNDFYPAGKIINQEPESGSLSAPQSKINITVSKGKETVTIPDLAGYDYVYASSSLEALGLNVIVKRESSAAYPSGTVIGTIPSAGASLNKNDIVQLVITVSEELLPVPALISMDYTKAAGILDSMGLSYEISYIKVDYSIQKDSVIAQYPEPNTNISFSEKIILFVGN